MISNLNSLEGTTVVKYLAMKIVGGGRTYYLFQVIVIFITACISRGFIIILVVFSILWIPVIERTQGGQLFIYIQAIAAYLAPPIAATYCLAITWKRMNESVSFNHHYLMLMFCFAVFFKASMEKYILPSTSLSC